MKLAFADLYRYVADPRAMEITPEQMLDDGYLDARARRIDMGRAGHPGFGSGVVVPGTGISLQNRGVGFSMDARSTNVVEGGKRLFHTIIPAFLTRDGAPVMSFGVMGGDMQPQGHLQTLVRMLDYRQQPQAACDAPRWKLNRDFTLDVEATLNADAVAALQARGTVSCCPRQTGRCRSSRNGNASASYGAMVRGLRNPRGFARAGRLRAGCGGGQQRVATAIALRRRAGAGRRADRAAQVLRPLRARAHQETQLPAYQCEPHGFVWRTCRVTAR
ncbi:hypothetical protein ACEQUB_02565 [Ralstonia syzygii]